MIDARLESMVHRFRPVAAVALGGAVATLLRWAALSADLLSEPISILALNVVGSGLMGVLIGRRERIHPELLAVLTVGVTGGLTTFSTFAVGVAEALDDGRLTAAAGLGLGTPVAAVLAAGLGFRLSRWTAVALGRSRRARPGSVTRSGPEQRS